MGDRIVAVSTHGVVSLDAKAWDDAVTHTLDQLWNGDLAPRQLGTTAKLLWTNSHLYVRFQCYYSELDVNNPLEVAELLRQGRETYALWDRDVCEIFVRSPAERDEMKYHEFEAAPTGEWCDLRVDRRSMTHDWEWQSGMRVRTRINGELQRWVALMEIPFSAFGAHPDHSEAPWYGNLFRVSRFEGERKYLAFSPTYAPQPNYHVPEKFVVLQFR